uniref:Myb-like domain-containing protein n=1 Tax=Tanacetum cinerariifolium TaxID=118510 RepID=A0A6L2JCH7_TANCI|nr:hypothetical protein [Tanacetum cinerariifolium]
MYTPHYSEDMYQNTAREESLVKVTAPPPKPSRRCQKRMDSIQNEDAPRCTTWTNEEEITLCKGWVHVSENSAKGNARNTDGFWTEVLDYLGKKTKQLGRRMYNMVNRKWNMVRPNVARFCGVYANVLHRAQDSGAGEEEYFNKAILDYEAEFEVPFTLRSSKTNEQGQSERTIDDMTHETLARLMVYELATQTASAMAMKKEERAAYMEIKRGGGMS